MSAQQHENVQILAISPDNPAESRQLIEGLSEKSDISLDFPLLTDHEHKVIDRYGLLNTSSKRGIPHPAVYVIDKDGKIVWRFVETDYKVRASNEQIMEALEGLEP